MCVLETVSGLVWNDLEEKKLRLGVKIIWEDSEHFPNKDRDQFICIFFYSDIYSSTNVHLFLPKFCYCFVLFIPHS